MKRLLWKCLFGSLATGALAIPLVAHLPGIGAPVPVGNTAGPLNTASPQPPRENGPAKVDPSLFADVTKGRIENPARDLLARSTPAAEPPPPASTGANPRVEPGKVHWHATLEKALAASESSGKPVLIFSMMGRLDEKFC